MKRTIRTVTVILLLATAVVVSQAPAQITAPKQSTQALTGVISDSMCGAKHMAKNKSAAECTRMCVQQGQKYALVVGDKVYTLNGHEAELDKLAGQRVTVNGTVSGDTVTVASVTAATKKPGA